MKKRALVLLILLSMTFSLSGCSYNVSEVNRDETSINTIEEDTTEEKSYINEEDKDSEEENLSKELEFESFTGYLKYKTLVRYDDCIGDNVCLTLEKGEAVNVIGESNSWYIIDVHDYDTSADSDFFQYAVGYVNKDFVSENIVENNTENEEIISDSTETDGITEVTDTTETVDETVNTENSVADGNSDEIEAVAEQASAASAGEAGTVISGDSLQADILSRINAYRAANGLGALQLTDQLCISAQTRASEMSYENAHTRPDGSHWSTTLTFTPKKDITEILACYVTSDVVEIWKNSASHNAALLGNYTYIGIGYKYNSDGSTYVAAHLY